jgi:flagellar protein FliL
MAEDKKLENTESEVAEGEESEEQQPKKKSNLLIIAIISIFVVLIAAGAYFLLVKTGTNDDTEVKEVVQMPSVFFQMPEMIVSLSGNTSNIRYLKLVLSLEIASEEDKAVVEAQLPKITDEFQTYLRQLRLEDLRGSIGTYRLKEALLLRTNQIVQPVEVKDVLLKEMLVQ